MHNDWLQAVFTMHFFLCSNSTPCTESMLAGVTIISQPTFSDSTSVLSHTLVLATEDTTDGPGTSSACSVM